MCETTIFLLSYFHVILGLFYLVAGTHAMAAPAESQG